MAPPSRNPSPRRLLNGALEVTARPWPHVPTTAHLIFSAGIFSAASASSEHSNSGAVLTPDMVAGWVPILRGMGFSAARTGAVGPDVASCLTVAGFVPVQELTLLSVDLPATGNAAQALPRDEQLARLRFMHGRRFQEVLDIDNRAFGTTWSLDAATLRDALGATGRSALWVARPARQPARGFVVVGATGNAGYVQRLAVHPGHQRHGTASHLLSRAHEWLVAAGCRTAVVNTEPTNTAALGLYRRFGYVPLSYGLQVLELDLTGAP